MDSASLKIQRAEQHIAELNEILLKQKPYTYVLEINLNTKQKATCAKRNKAITDSIVIIIGDVIHNLRSSLDHAYWAATEAFAKTAQEKRRIQFPILKSGKDFFEKTIPNLPNDISKSFISSLIELKPFRGPGGNKLLCAIHDLDITDKHKILIPTTNLTSIDSITIQKEVPNFPSGLINGKIGAGGEGSKDVVWNMSLAEISGCYAMNFPPSGILEQELNIPVDLALHIDGFNGILPVIETLQEFVKTAKTAIESLRAS